MAINPVNTDAKIMIDVSLLIKYIPGVDNDININAPTENKKLSRFSKKKKSTRNIKYLPVVGTLPSNGIKIAVISIAIKAAPLAAARARTPSSM